MPCLEPTANDAQLIILQEVKKIDYIKRSPAERLKKYFSRFIKSYTNEKDVSIGSASYYLYSRFIIESYNLSVENRYSISEIARKLKQANFEKVVVNYLVVRYLDGMYLLAQLQSKEEKFWP